MLPSISWGLIWQVDVAQAWRSPEEEALGFGMFA
jgi:hypothetical protein